MSFVLSFQNEVDVHGTGANLALSNIRYCGNAFRFGRDSFDFERDASKDSNFAIGATGGVSISDYQPFGYFTSPLNITNWVLITRTGNDIADLKVRSLIKTPVLQNLGSGYFPVFIRSSFISSKINGYSLRINYVSPSYVLEMWKSVNSVFTKLGSVSISINSHTFYYMQLEASGTNIIGRLFDINLTQLASISAVDSAIATGGIGVMDYPGTNYAFEFSYADYILALDETNTIGTIIFPSTNYYDSGETGKWHLSIGFPHQDSLGNNLTFEVYEADSATGLNSRGVPPISSNSNVYNMSGRYVRIIITWNRGVATAQPTINSSLNITGFGGELITGTSKSSSLLPF